MVSLPPGPAAGPSVPPNAPTPKEKDPAGPPQTVRYLLRALALMLGMEVIHQILSAVVILMDPSTLREGAREAAKASGEQVSDVMVNVSVYASVAMMLAFQLVIVSVLVFALRTIARAGSPSTTGTAFGSGRAGFAPKALRLLQFFSGFFVLRVLLLFAITPVSAAIPTAVYAIDGVLQIIAGAAGACALAYSVQDVVHKHVTAHAQKRENSPPNGK